MTPILTRVRCVWRKKKAANSNEEQQQPQQQQQQVLDCIASTSNGMSARLTASDIQHGARCPRLPTMNPPETDADNQSNFLRKLPRSHTAENRCSEFRLQWRAQIEKARLRIAAAAAGGAEKSQPKSKAGDCSCGIRDRCQFFSTRRLRGILCATRATAVVTDDSDDDSDWDDDRNHIVSCADKELSTADIQCTGYRVPPLASPLRRQPASFFVFVSLSSSSNSAGEEQNLKSAPEPEDNSELNNELEEDANAEARLLTKPNANPHGGIKVQRESEPEAEPEVEPKYSEVKTYGNQDFSRQQRPRIKQKPTQTAAQPNSEHSLKTEEACQAKQSCGNADGDCGVWPDWAPQDMGVSDLSVLDEAEYQKLFQRRAKALIGSCNTNESTGQCQLEPRQIHAAELPEPPAATVAEASPLLSSTSPGDINQSAGSANYLIITLTRLTNNSTNANNRLEDDGMIE